MIEAPWEFSEDPASGEGVPNVRSPEGAALGREIARLCDVEEAKQTSTTQLPRCTDCAARLGTLPNENTETQMNFIKCVVEGIPFFCHKGIPEGDEPSRLCAGWVLLQTSGTLVSKTDREGSLKDALGNGDAL